MEKYKFFLANVKGVTSWWREYEPDGLFLFNHQGGYISKLGIEKAIDIVEAESFSHLDWTVTDYISDSIPTGWINTNGEYFGFHGAFNNSLTSIYFRLDTYELDDLGWVRVHGDGKYTYKHEPNHLQREKLA